MITKKFTLMISYYTFEKFECKVVKKLKKGYYYVLECNKNGIVIRKYIDNWLK